jgi:hypothetical protein
VTDTILRSLSLPEPPKSVDPATARWAKDLMDALVRDRQKLAEALVVRFNDVYHPPSVALRTTANQTFPHNTVTTVTWDYEIYDSWGFHDLSVNPERITCPVNMAGTYLVVASIYMYYSKVFVDNWEVGVKRNVEVGNVGRTTAPLVYYSGTIDGALSQVAPYSVAHVICMPALVAGDYLTVWARHMDGVSEVIAGPSIQTSFYMVRMSL